MQTGRIGLWTHLLDLQPMALACEAAQEIEALGFSTLWVPESLWREPFTSCAILLGATSRLRLATGVANIYARRPLTMAAGWATLTEAYPERFLLGLGVGSAAKTRVRFGLEYRKPYTTMVSYLDDMDASPYLAAPPTTPRCRVLAGLGPKMLELARARTMGTHPYNVPVEHTHVAREAMGPGPWIMPEQAVLMETDPTPAREIARRFLTPFLDPPSYSGNYATNLRRLGFSDADLAGPSNRLVDSLVAWGSLDRIVARVRAHLDAGADHVSLQVLTNDRQLLPMREWRELASALADLER
jgi:probable F420-dependent oxidoreductase